MIENETDEEFIKRVKNFDGCGYGDPEARLNDDRRLQIIIAERSMKNERLLNWMTGILVILTVTLVFEAILR